MNYKVGFIYRFVLFGVLSMSCWFHSLVYTLGKAYGLPVKRPQAKVQQLIMAIGGEPHSLDPHKTVGAEEQQIISDLLEGPYIVDNQGNPIPGAFVYAYTNDQQEWTFNLRFGLQWSDGSPVTAYDFVYSWQRLADPQTASPKAGILQDMGIKNIDDIIAGKRPSSDLGVIASGPSTLHLFLSKPLGFITKLLTNTALVPVHRATIEKYCDNWTHPDNYVGNGAYCLKERLMNDKVVLTRNPHYWDDANTSINQVTYLPLDADTELAHYKRGLLDVTTQMSSARSNQLLLQFPTEIQWVNSTTIDGCLLNTQAEPFNDVRVRQALNLVLDRETLFQSLAITGQSPAYNLVPDGVGGLSAFQPPWKLWNFERRVEKAKQLLQAAGFDEKKPLEFSLLYNDSGENRRLAVYLSALWKAQLGAKVTLDQQEWKVFLEMGQERKYQMMRYVMAGYNEPYSLLRYFISHHCSNESGYANSQFDHCLEKTLNETRGYERFPWYCQAEALLAEEVPIIPLSHPHYALLVKPYVGGLDPENQFEGFYTKNLYIRQHPQAPKAPRK